MGYQAQVPPHRIDYLRALFRRDEGEDRHVYQDTKGFWTIGRGRNVDARTGPGLRDVEIEFMFVNDIAELHHELADRVPNYLAVSDVRQAVLIDMGHNLGVDGLLGFHEMMKALQRLDYPAAGHEMLNSKWRSDVGEGRAQRLTQMMLTGMWPEDLKL